MHATQYAADAFGTQCEQRKQDCVEVELMQERGLKIPERKFPFNFLEGPSRVPGAGRSDIMPNLYPEGQGQKQTIISTVPAISHAKWMWQRYPNV